MVVAAGASFVAHDALATTGYFSHGFGARMKGMGGVGVAIPTDTQSAMRNPASMVDVGDRVDVGIGAFNPNRSFTATGAGGLPDGTTDSDKKWFPIPDAGYNRMMGENWSLGITLSANGGMNTEYPTAVFAGFGAGTAPTGVDLSQGFLGITYARKLDEHNAIGITPTLAIQRFKATGLEAFQGVSTDPTHVTNNGYDTSFGGGVRIGYLGTFDNFRVGVSYQTKMYMSRFDKYAGLFAEQGDFDIPATFQAGVAYSFPQGVTVGADYQRIMYGEIAAIANNGYGSLAGAALGSNTGYGFGWETINVFRLGAQWQVNDSLTVRAGGSYNDKPFDGNQNLFNVLAPGVPTVHLSAGLSYKFGPHHEITAGYTRVFSDSVTGTTHPTVGGETLKLEMDQHDFAVGYTYRW
jgi:long-chain fatty acid transport protein